jgi:UPF0716 protein FxsA
MGRLFKFLAILLPAIEIVVILLVGEEFGVAPTMLALLAGVVVGMAVIKFQGGAALREFQDATRRGVSPIESLRHGAITLGAGALFIIPGFVTDVLAILLLARAGWLRLRQPSMPEQGLGDVYNRSAGQGAGQGAVRIVDAEYIIVEKHGESDPAKPEVPHPKREAP